MIGRFLRALVEALSSPAHPKPRHGWHRGYVPGPGALDEDLRRRGECRYGR